MQQTPRKRKCRHRYFSRLMADTLHCVKNPPALDHDTGWARWPKREHLGYFADETEAAKAYDTAAKKYHEEFANLNFPEK